MTRYWIAAVLACFIGNAAVAGPSAEAELRAAYRTDQAAFNRGDVDAMMRDIDPGFTYRATDEPPVNRTAYEAGLRKVVTIKPHDACTIKRIAIHGDQAEVLVNDLMTYTRPNKDRIVETSNNREIWHHTAAGWRIIQSTELDRHYTVNGKPSSSTHLPRM